MRNRFQSLVGIGQDTVAERGARKGVDLSCQERGDGLGLIFEGGSEHYPDAFREHGHLRLSIGLEDPDDLIADIQAALDETFT